MDRSTILIVGAIGGAVVLAIGMIVVSAFRPLSTLETALWQLISLTAGLFGSYLLGRRAAREAAMEVVRMHARPAVRRLLAIRDSLLRLSAKVEEFQQEEEDPRLAIIQAIVEERIGIAESAVDDWRDVAPDDVDDAIRHRQSHLRPNPNGNQ